METTGSASPAKTLMLICQKRKLHAIMKEFEDWSLKEGIDLKVVLYGTMQKSRDGFLLFALNHPLPEGVYTNLALDDDIGDYVQYESTPPTTETPA
jgi:hypothetical protein